MSAEAPEGDSPLERPRTLAEANHAVAMCHPRQDAPPSDWLAYHQRAAAWYAEVAEIDRGHHHESLYLAKHQQTLAKETKARILTQGETGEEDRG